MSFLSQGTSCQDHGVLGRFTFISNGFSFGDVHAWVAAALFRDDSAILFAYGPESPLPTILLDPQTGGGCKLVDGLAAPLLRRSLRYDERGGKFIEYGGDKRPRRIWDICANRVVPTTWFPTVPFVMAPMGIVFTLENLITPVSHAWVAPEDLEFVAMS